MVVGDTEMEKWRKKLAAFLVLAMLGLCGCSGGGETETTVTNAQVLADAMDLFLDEPLNDRSSEDWYKPYYEAAKESIWYSRLNSVEPDENCSYRDAWVILYYQIVESGSEKDLEVVLQPDPMEILKLTSGSELDRELLFLCRWGIVHGSLPQSVYDAITSSQWKQMLEYYQQPALRQKLLPSIKERVSYKLKNCHRCRCLTEELEGEQELFSVLKDAVGEEPALLTDSCWFLDRNTEGFLVLTSITIRDGSCEVRRYAETGAVEVLTDQVYAACLTQEQILEVERVRPYYMEILEAYILPEDPEAADYAVCYAEYRVEEPVLLLIRRDVEYKALTVGLQYNGDPMWFTERKPASWYNLLD